MLILLLAVLLIFGPKRLPEMGRQLGRGMRELKDGITGKDEPDQPVSMTELDEADPPTSTSSSGAPVRERDALS
jgi:sec-independent protein translocase protein TatA